MRKILIVADCNRNRRVFAVRTVFYESQIVKDPTTKVPTVRIYLRLAIAGKLLKSLEAAIGIEPMNKGLQCSALPLGYVRPREILQGC